MNNYIYISVKGFSNRFIDKCIKNNINLYDVTYNGDDLIVKIDYKDYKRVKRLNYYSKIKIVKYEGLNAVKKHIKDYIYTYILLFLSFILMDIMTSYIVDINVIHENKMIRSLVLKELNNYGIQKYKLGIGFEESEKIKNEILKDNPNTLEWISITKSGMKYIIRVEERIINKKEIESGYRHIVAKKNAMITKITSTKGEELVRSNDYVKKGDILISGEIKLYDNVKGNTLATGSVYGNVWYNTLVSIPKVNEKKVYTGRKRYNLNINNKIFLKNKYNLFLQENVRELKIFGLKIKIYREVEYKMVSYKINSKEADKMVKKMVISEFSKKLKDNGKIIMQNTLKKEENDSTIDYRIFVVTNELISDYLYYIVGDNNDTQSSN